MLLGEKCFFYIPLAFHWVRIDLTDHFHLRAHVNRGELVRTAAKYTLTKSTTVILCIRVE